MGKLGGFEVILPVLIRELELGAFFLHKFPFPLIELIRLSYPIRAGIIAAFGDGDLLPLLPRKEGMMTIGTVVPGLLPESSLDLEEFIADFAQKLSPFLPVIVIEILMGSMTGRTNDEIRDADRTCSISHRS
jgi:hypothetical protein